jgi:hypothetical protein
MNLLILQQNNKGNSKISADIDKKIIREQVSDLERKKEEIAKLDKMIQPERKQVDNNENALSS